MGRAEHHVVVVGSGAAGGAAALALRRADTRQAGAAPAVTVVGAEDRLPYNRTTVNKGLLAGTVDDEAIALPGMAEVGTRWLTGTAAVALVAFERAVLLADGSRVLADAVVLATGARPRVPPAEVEPAAAGRVLLLRTADDTRRLLALLATAGTAADGGAARVVVAGGGLIGTKTAAVLLAAGCDVTLVDPADRPLAGRLRPTVAGWIAEQHRTAGVDLHVRATVTQVHADGAGVLVRLGDGSTVTAVAVVACLGVEPTPPRHPSAPPRCMRSRAAGGLWQRALRTVAAPLTVHAARRGRISPRKRGLALPIRVRSRDADLARRARCCQGRDRPVDEEPGVHRDGGRAACLPPPAGGAGLAPLRR